MNAFSVMGPNAASWKPVEGKHTSIFGVDDTYGGLSSTSADAGPGSSSSGGSMLLNADLAAATNALRNVTITKATLLQSYNTFGIPLGVSISCLPKNEVVDTGDKYTFTTIPNTSVNTPATLYEAGESHAHAMDWMRTFGKYNAGNINTQDVLKVCAYSHTRFWIDTCIVHSRNTQQQNKTKQVPGCPFVFVRENHPVINLLRINKNLLGVDVDEQPKMDGEWHKVTQSLFDSSCDTIRNRILAKIETKDLSNLTVVLLYMTHPPHLCTPMHDLAHTLWS